MGVTLGQRSFDDLGTPLHATTFCVIDLETTGGSPIDDEITEVGAVKLRGGECLGTFQTLVNPGRDIPVHITALTGITHTMTRPAPTIGQVLPSLLEFIGDSVIVGHNIRFDISFLDAALMRRDRPRLEHRRVDTAALARRLVRDEVPNCRLGTLADRLRLDHKPSHRALDDALATGDLLNVLLERAAAFGVFGLDDLLGLPTMAGHAQAGKLGLTTSLPRQGGVYRFLDPTGQVLYVGKAANLRARVRSYFSSDDRRKIGGLLRETAAIDHTVCAHGLEAAVREIREIHRLLPRYNRQGTTWRRARYLKLTTEAFPRLSIVQAPRPDGAAYLGPIGTARRARLVADAVESALPLRRCTDDPRRAVRTGPCGPAQLGVATCPCAGAVDGPTYDEIAARAAAALRGDSAPVLDVLRARIDALAMAERYEEAADTRDRAAAYGQAVAASRRAGALRRAGRVVLDLPGGGVELEHGALVASWGTDGASQLDLAADRPVVPADPSCPLPREAADELAVVGAWIDRNRAQIRIREVSGEWSEPATPIPDFTPVRARPSGQG
jgi:DNA polymerase-3 subunit epsilon